MNCGFLSGMKARIASFRGSRRIRKGNQCIIIVDKVTTKEEAKQLVGKTVSWKTSGKEPKTITGKVTAAHGNKGALRVLFEKGMPGQCLGTEVEIQ